MYLRCSSFLTPQITETCHTLLNVQKTAGDVSELRGAVDFQTLTSHFMKKGTHVSYIHRQQDETDYTRHSPETHRRAGETKSVWESY